MQTGLLFGPQTYTRTQYFHNINYCDEINTNVLNLLCGDTA